MTIVQLPVDPRYPRMRSVELYDDAGRLLMIGRSVGEAGSVGSYEDAATAARNAMRTQAAFAGLIQLATGMDTPELVTEWQESKHHVAPDWAVKAARRRIRWAAIFCGAVGVGLCLAAFVLSQGWTSVGLAWVGSILIFLSLYL